MIRKQHLKSWYKLYNCTAHYIIIIHIIMFNFPLNNSRYYIQETVIKSVRRVLPINELVIIGKLCHRTRMKSGILYLQLAGNP